jgi:hypothetical protein
MTKNQKAFDATIRRLEHLVQLSEETTASVMGSGVATAVVGMSQGRPVDGFVVFQMRFLNHGKYNLYEVSSEIKETIYPNDDSQVTFAKINDVQRYQVGTLPPLRFTETTFPIRVHPLGGKYFMTISF